MTNELIEALAEEYPDSEQQMTVVDFADWLRSKTQGYRMVPELLDTDEMAALRRCQD